MTTRLTADQLAVIASRAAEPVPMENDEGEVVGYFVTSQALINLQTLREKIAKADASPGVPAEDAHVRIRQMAAAAAKKHA